jgi:tetratricopeptide (TPR) repeat protein
MSRFYAVCAGLLCLLTACGVNPAARNNAGNTYVAQNEYDRALSAYRDAQTAEPDNPVFAYNSAAALSATGRIDDAQAALQEAIATGDTALAATAYYNLGNLHLETENYAAAVAAYRESLLLNPDNDDARYNLELATWLLNQVTPTAIEMQTDPDDRQANPSVTPTPNPAGDPSQPTPSPTPTPTPPGDIPPPGPSPAYEGTEEEGAEDNGTPTPGPDRENAEEDIENAEEVMEFVESEQENLPDYRQQATPGAEPTIVLDRDW